jgi:tetratricopeptide (TPR) repeat protein
MADLELQDIPPRIREGMALVDRGVLEKAQEIFEGYLEAYPESTLALSYVGMLKAVRESQTRQGIDMCTEALRRDPNEALCYLNLSKAYLTEGDRYQCVRTLHRGLKIRTPHKDHLMGFYRIIGLRRKPVLPFLSRNNPLNQLLGRLTWKLKKA